jgi:hypothetical protein
VRRGPRHLVQCTAISCYAGRWFGVWDVKLSWRKRNTCWRNQKCSKMMSEWALSVRCEFAASENKSASNPCGFITHNTPTAKYYNENARIKNGHLFHCSTALVGLRLLIVEVSRSHSDIPHSKTKLVAKQKADGLTFSCINRQIVPVHKIQFCFRASTVSHEWKCCISIAFAGNEAVKPLLCKSGQRICGYLQYNINFAQSFPNSACVFQCYLNVWNGTFC